MNRREKEGAVAKLREGLEPDGHVVLAEYRGLTVEEMTQLRRQVRAAEGRLQVLKNTLIRRAVEGTAKEGLGDLLTGPNALFYTKADPLAMVKVVAGASKTHAAVQIKGGMVEGRTFSATEILRIAELPPREELLAKALGSMSAPIQGLVNVLQGVTRGLVNVLDSIREQKAAAG